METTKRSPVVVFRIKVIIAIAVLVPIGLYSKVYNGPIASWINNDVVGIWYVIAWCLGVAFIWPRFPGWKIALVVFLVTCFLEVLQLSEWYTLEWARSFFIGRLVLGTTFIWLDFFYYILGGLAAWGLLSIWQNKL